MADPLSSPPQNCPGKPPTSRPPALPAAHAALPPRFGLTAALPLALFLPNAWRAETAAGGLLASFPSMAASCLVRTAISTLDLAAFGQTVHLFAARRRRQAAVAGSGGGCKEGGGNGRNGGGGVRGFATKAKWWRRRGKAEEGEDGQGQAADRAARAQLAAPLGPLDILRVGRRPRAGEAAAAAAPLPSPLLLSRAGLMEVRRGEGANSPGHAAGQLPRLRSRDLALGLAGSGLDLASPPDRPPPAPPRHTVHVTSHSAVACHTGSSQACSPCAPGPSPVHPGPQADRGGAAGLGPGART